MKYYQPETVTEATEILRGEGNAKVVAGGQSMMPLLRQDIVSPEALVDITAIDGLDEITVSGGTVEIGALVRYTDVLEHDVCERLDLLRDSIEAIGDKQVRNAGTIGGGVAHADPAQDLPPALQCYEALAHAGTEDEPYELTDFFIDFYFTELPPEEIVTRIEFDLPPSSAGGAFEKHARTPGGFSEAGIAALVLPGEDGYEDVRIAYCAGGPAPKRVPSDVEARLEGDVTPEQIKRAGEAMVDSLDIVSDIGDDVQQTEHLFKVLLKRAVRTAAERSDGPDIQN